MIIKQLVLNNFRQFTGQQIINFSTSEEKKVTLLMADSGYGKTTLIQAFQWIFYGTCKYKTPINIDIKSKMFPHSDEIVSGIIIINHNNTEFAIKRIQKFYKIQSSVQADPSELIIDVKNINDGTTDQKKGREADKIIKDIIHKDLFPYFFLEGENLIKVGEQMSRGRNGTNSEFVKAIKGLLGFNFLYEAEKHLGLISKEYLNDIKNNTTDEKIKEIIKQIDSYNNLISNCKDRLEIIDTEILYNQNKRDELSDMISKYSDLEAKQSRTKKIGREIPEIIDRIKEQKKYIFKKFSELGFYTLMKAMLPEVNKTLENSDSLDKGIPGITVDAVEYMLNNHKCICGSELKENTKEWNELKTLIDFLPPNNIGYEVERFTQDINNVDKYSKSFNEDFIKARKDLTDLLTKYDELKEELDSLNTDIGSFDKDVYILKEDEKRYNQKVIDLYIEKDNKKHIIENAIKQIEVLNEEQNKYKLLDAKTNKIKRYYDEAEHLRTKIIRFCSKKETQKREALEKAINEIFKDFYNEMITFELDENYGVKIQTINTELSDDFTSGGQDVAVALAFIGAIIKLIGEKDDDPDTIIDESEREEYPLVMDAPTSNFGMKQMDSFSNIMPKITDQIIVFINDKDGPILKEKMRSKIGSEWTLQKIDTYHSKIVEVINCGK